MGLILNPLTGQLDFTGSGGGGPSPAVPKYVASFTTADFTGPSSGLYSISIATATHGHGATPTIQVFELVSGSYNLVQIETIIDSMGDITLNVLSSPDLRFNGKYIIS